MTTAIFFDLDGTLLRYDDYHAVLLSAFESRLGAPNRKLVDAYDAAFQEAFRALEPDPHLSAMETACQSVGVGADPRALVDALRERERDAARVPPGIRRLLAAVEDYPLGVLTNGVGDWQRGKLAAHGLDGFDAVVTSYDVGAHKPDREAFDRAEDAIDADTYVLVGDDYETDVVGARDAGWEAVYVDRDSEVGVATGEPAQLAALIEALV